jgi:nucleoid-associated protein YgaU
MGTKGKLVVIALLMSGIVALLVWSKNGDRKRSQTPAAANGGAVESNAGPSDPADPQPRFDADQNHPPSADPPTDEPGMRIETAGSPPDTPPAASTDHNRNPQPAANREPETGTKSYTVSPGDSWALISKKVYGKESKWRRIFEANRDKVSSEDDFLRVGMVLTIPPLPEPPVAPAPEVAAAPRDPDPAPAGGAPAPTKTYKVKSGDTLSSIAKATMGDANKWKAIYAANRDRLPHPDSLMEGQELVIPDNR